MRITFAALGSEQLAIGLLSGIAKQMGHEVNLVFTPSLFHDRWNLELPSLSKFFDDSKEFNRALAESNPDVLVFSLLTSTYQWGLSVARHAKTIMPDVVTVFGGVHISAVPQRVIKNKEVDFLVVGEGELAFPKILDKIEAKDCSNNPIENTWYRSATGEVIKGMQKGFNQDLDSLPYYDKELWEDHIRIGDKYLTMASRGCPYRCSFCFNNFFARLPEEQNKGKYVRFRAVEHMIGELKWAKQRYNIRCIDFQDDVFTADKKWLKEFLDRYREEIALPFQCLTHPKYMDEEIATWMKDAGCNWVQMGVQSMDDEFKKGLLRYERAEDIADACRIMNEKGINVKLDHMLGLPDEPITAQENARKLYAEYVPRRIQTYWTCFLPGTDLLKQGIAAGIVKPEDVERLEEGIDFYFYRNVDNIKNPELVALYKRYEIIFRIMPLLPKRVRQNLTPEKIEWIPVSAVQFLSRVGDLIVGLRYMNPDFVMYMRHYLFHLWRFVLVKLFNINLKASKIKEAAPALNYKPRPRPVEFAEAV